MLPSIGLVLSVEMIRDGGSLAAVFQGSNGAEYWLFFEIRTRRLPSGQLERLGYQDPVVIERQVNLPITISWQHATIMLHQMRPLIRDASSLEWLGIMEATAESRGELPRSEPRTLDPVKLMPGTLEYAASFISYFSHHAETQPLFQPEVEVSERVVAMMSQPEPDLAAIVREMRGIGESPHHDGTGWHGFKNAVRAWLQARGGTL